MGLSADLYSRYINVDDGCWRQNVFVISWRCWTNIVGDVLSNFGHTHHVSLKNLKLRFASKNNIQNVTNTQKWSPTSLSAMSNQKTHLRYSFLLFSVLKEYFS